MNTEFWIYGNVTYECIDYYLKMVLQLMLNYIHISHIHRRKTLQMYGQNIKNEYL